MHWLSRSVCKVFIAENLLWKLFNYLARNKCLPGMEFQTEIWDDNSFGARRDLDRELVFLFYYFLVFFYKFPPRITRRNSLLAKRLSLLGALSYDRMANLQLLFSFFTISLLVFYMLLHQPLFIPSLCLPHPLPLPFLSTPSPPILLANMYEKVNRLITYFSGFWFCTNYSPEEREKDR